MLDIIYRHEIEAERAKANGFAENGDMAAALDHLQYTAERYAEALSASEASPAFWGVKFTPQQAKVVGLLRQNFDGFVEIARLKMVLDQDVEDLDDALRNRIQEIREKLPPEFTVINARGFGYRIGFRTKGRRNRNIYETPHQWYFHPIVEMNGEPQALAKMDVPYLPNFDATLAAMPALGLEYDHETKRWSREGDPHRYLIGLVLEGDPSKMPSEEAGGQ